MRRGKVDRGGGQIEGCRGGGGEEKWGTERGKGGRSRGEMESRNRARGSGVGEGCKGGGKTGEGVESEGGENWGEG